MMLMRLGSCGKRKGDLVLEDDEWRCLQCGSYYYPEYSSPAVDAMLQPAGRETPRQYRKDRGPTSEEVSALLSLSPVYVRE